MKKKRQKYTQEFKEEAVKLITEQGYKITEAARNLGVNENLLGRWKRGIEGVGEEPSSLQVQRKCRQSCISFEKRINA